MPSLQETVADLNEKEAIDLVKNKIEAGENPLEIVEELRAAMETIGHRFEEKEYFVTELIMGAEIFKECMNLVEPKFKREAVSSLGRVIIGTVKDDIHDLGKNIVVAMLRGVGFEVHDLGVDVPPEKFVEKAEEIDPDVIGLCALITTAIESMKDTIEAIRKAGIGAKIMIGGGIVSRDEATKEYVGADAVGKDASEAIRLAKKFVKKEE